MFIIYASFDLLQRMATVNFLPLLACVCTLSGLLSASPLGEVAQSESDAPSPPSSGSFKNAIYK